MISENLSRLSRRKFLRNSAYVASGLAASTAISACNASTTSSPSQSPTQSKVQDTLYIYGWATYVDNEEILKDFTAETGIKIVGDSYDSNEVMLAKLQASSGKSNYSAIYPSDYMVTQMIAPGLLAKVDKTKIPNLSNLDRSFVKNAYDPENVYSVPISWGTTGIAYNVKAVQKSIGSEPKDWSYLWEHKEQLKGKLTLLNDVREVMAMALHTLKYDYNSTDAAQIKQAFEKLQELKPSVASFETDAWRDRLIAGDLAVAMAFSGDGLSVARQNPDVKYIIPESGASIWTDTIAIPKDAPNTEAAYIWINYLLRPEVAAKVSNSNSFGTTNKSAIDRIAPDLKNIAAWSPTQESIDKGGRLVKLDPAILQIYESYWTKLTST